MSSRNWCFTLNNYSETNVQSLKNEKCNYIVFGYEVGENGTPHLQGYIEYSSAVKMATLKKRLKDRIHWEVRKGTAKQASDYCKKDGKFFEAGAMSEQGKRTDITNIKDMLEEGVTDRKKLFKAANSYQAFRMAEIGLSLYSKQRDWKTEVRWYWGPTGCGKTRRAVKETVNPWISNDSLEWWQGYRAHEHVIFDDFRADFCKFRVLLRILDRYPYKVMIKGGDEELVAKLIIITSPYHPTDIYRNRTNEDVRQLLRRIEVIEEMKGTEETTFNNVQQHQQLINFEKSETEVRGNTSNKLHPDLDLSEIGKKLGDGFNIGGDEEEVKIILGDINNDKDVKMIEKYIG